MAATRKNVAVIIVAADGRVAKLVRRRPPTLDQLQKLVGGYIEIVPHLNRYGDYRRGTAYVNEEGRIRELPFNRRATEAWTDCLRGGGPLRYEPRLYGDMVYCAATEEPVTD